MNYRKYWKFIAVFTLLLLAGVLFFVWRNARSEKVCFEKHCFSVEVAQNEEDLAKGLMFRTNLAQGQGMLFVFSREGYYIFWMKNTLIPLDMIWINQNKEVVFIANNVQPCKQDPCISINPDKEAKYVLEINGGISEQIGLTVGSKLEF